MLAQPVVAYNVAVFFAVVFGSKTGGKKYDFFHWVTEMAAGTLAFWNRSTWGQYVMFTVQTLKY